MCFFFIFQIKYSWFLAHGDSSLSALLDALEDLAVLFDSSCTDLFFLHFLLISAWFWIVEVLLSGLFTDFVWRISLSKGDTTLLSNVFSSTCSVSYRSGDLQRWGLALGLAYKSDVCLDLDKLLSWTVPKLPISFSRSSFSMEMIFSVHALRFVSQWYLPHYRRSSLQYLQIYRCGSIYVINRFLYNFRRVAFYLWQTCMYGVI